MAQEILQRILVGLLGVGIGALAFIMLFKTEQFRGWLADHLDRNKSTDEAMYDLTPRGSLLEASEGPNWYYRLIGVVALIMAALTLITAIFGKQ